MLWCEYPGAVLGIEVLQNYGCRMASGLGLTLQLVAISFGIGLIAGLGLALLRLNAPRPLAWLVGAYMTVFRGTPLLGQLFLIYYGLGSFRLFWQDVGLWWLFRDPLYCCLLAFTLNTAAYQAEILRGAIQSVARGQWEGAAALGLHRVQALRLVVLPQALVVALRPYGNELILMIKGSAIVAIITVYDLMGETRRAYSRSFDFQTYLWAALLYLALVESLRHAVDWIERRITRHLVR